MSIQLMIVVLYVAMLFAISFYVKRRAETSATEYQFAGRKFGALLIAVSVTGMAVGARKKQKDRLTLRQNAKPLSVHA